MINICSCTGEGVGKLLYGGRYRRASGMAPLFRSGNIYIGILFRPQIYEFPQVFRQSCMNDQISFTRIRKKKLCTISNSIQCLLNMLYIHLLCTGYILSINEFILTTKIYQWFPFSSCPYIRMGRVFGLSDARPYQSLCPPPSPAPECS